MWVNSLNSLSPPRYNQAVHREECTQCFDNQDGVDGIDVCLTCYNGGCLDRSRHHAQTHFERTGHPLSLNIKRRPKPSRGDQEPPLKRIAIQEDREEDMYSFETTLRSWVDGGALLPEGSKNAKAKSLIEEVMATMSSARQSEVKAWEEELIGCEHTLTIHQTQSKLIPAVGQAHCADCELTTNLWLCLACGSLGCGRQQFGGVGGNSHGLRHYEESKHPIAVKLGTITAEGTADVYCYDCNESRIDPELSTHLSKFGISIYNQVKTEKTMTELQIEQNLRFDFSLTGEDGKILQPVTGPGLTGLRNLGNSCYMASMIQALFALPSFKDRYGNDATAAIHALTCPEPHPATCLECQMLKMADGLLSGRYSVPRVRPDIKSDHSQFQSPTQDEEPAVVFQEGIKPSMFKALIGRGHPEFSTMKQQDSEEFFTHFLKVLRQDHKKRETAATDGIDDATEVFRYVIEQRLQCMDCQRVSYRVDSQDVVSVPVPTRAKNGGAKNHLGKVEYEDVQLETCLDMLTSVETLEYRCPSCNKNVIAIKQSKFSTFPSILVIQARKFQLVDWVPQKLDIPVRLPPSNTLSLDKYIAHGIQEGEVPLPTEDAASSSTAPALPEFNEEVLAMLEGMGFLRIRCQKALLATGNSDGEAAIEWLFAHMDDADLDDPIQPQPTSLISGPDPSSEAISMITDMGFTTAQASKALKETGGNLERAIDWLFSHPDDTGENNIAAGVSSSPASAGSNGSGGSNALPASYRLKAFISHKGPSVHSGHYVAHIRVRQSGAGTGTSEDDGEWIFFNDEKVVRADAESVETLKPLAYLYIFERL